MRGVAAGALLVLVALAGCSGGEHGRPSTSDDAAFEDLRLAATKDTGVLRGVVIDEAVRPLANASITITGPGGPAANLTTNQAGGFGIDGLEPGDYFLQASKPGFATVQASTNVVAGLANPDAVKVMLLADASMRPYPQQYILDGYLTCSARIVLTAYPAGECLPESDTSQVLYDLDRVPDWAQSEMTWDSTQSLGDAMSLVSECFGPGIDDGAATDPSPCPDGNLVVNRSEGSSPLIIKMDQSLLAQFRIGDGPTGAAYRLRVFAAGRSDTDLINEDSNNSQLNSTTGGLYPCVAWPAINQGCFRFTGTGVILQQQFKVFTTVFYGYVPPPDWLFSAGDPVPPPA